MERDHLQQKSADSEKVIKERGVVKEESNQGAPSRK